MATHQQFCLERAQEARKEAGITSLENVRERALRAAAAWDEMASRAERTTRLRAQTEAAKAAKSSYS